MTPNAFESTLCRHLTAIEHHDLDTFAATISENVRLVGTDGRITAGFDAAVEAHRAWFADAGWSIALSPLLTEQFGGCGWSLIDAVYRSGGGERRFLLFTLFCEENGEWKLVYDQGTDVPSGD